MWSFCHKSFILTLLSLFLLCACSKEKQDDNAAALAAKEYYDHLLAGRYADYVGGFADADSLPPSYREQLLANAKQFMAQQKAEHGGITEVGVVSVNTDSTTMRASAFLMLCFGDSTREEIVVPMTERGGRWLMR